MGLVKCPQCGNPVSDRAHACVRCGYDVRRHYNQIARKEAFELEQKEREAKRIKEAEEKARRDEYIDFLPPFKRFIYRKPKTFALIIFLLIAAVAAAIIAVCIHRENTRSEFEIVDGLYLNMTKDEVQTWFHEADNGSFNLISDLNRKYPNHHIYTTDGKHSYYKGMNHVNGIDIIFPGEKLKEVRFGIERDNYGWCDECSYYRNDLDHLLHDFDLDQYEFTKGKIDNLCDQTLHTTVNNVDIIIVAGTVDEDTGECKHHDDWYTVIFR